MNNIKKTSGNKKIGVLVFPAGEVNSMELHDALCDCVNIELWGASSIERHGKYVFKNYVSGLPLINDEDFIDKMNELIEEHDIDAIFPTHDSVALFLVENSNRINAKIISADLETTQACRDKKITYQKLCGESFVPRIYEKIEELPVFIKPREGQGSVGAMLIKNAEEIPNIDISKYVICEYLPGAEYTIDCITDSRGILKGVFPRKRSRIQFGITAHGDTLQCNEEIKNIAEKINGRFHFEGLWWFQLKEDANGSLKLLEISTRCAGTMGLTRMRGVNLPLLSVYNSLGYPIEIIDNDYAVEIDRTLIGCYHCNLDYKNVYIDYDDTVIVNGMVHPTIIRLLYQWHSNGIKVNLISRHDEDHDDTLEDNLRKHGISSELFNSIIKLTFKDKKSDFINKDNAIFIDNAFKERVDVKRTLKIPVFDVDTTEALLDYRR